MGYYTKKPKACSPVIARSGSDVAIWGVRWREGCFITDRTGIGFGLFPFPAQIAALRTQ